MASGTLGAGSRSGAIARPDTTTERLSAIQDAKNLVERLAQLDHRLTRRDVGEPVSGPECSANRDDSFAEGGSVSIAKLRRPGTVGQESGAGALINQLIEDALK
jgi:hypothetical protein